MKLTKLSIVLLLILSYLSFGQPTFAHILKADGSIGAVLHIDPNDDPVAGQTSSFYFEFKDKQGQFDLSKCSCQVTISESGNQLYTQTLTYPTFQFTFPQKNIYQLVLTGQPLPGNTFQSFTLIYDIRVANEVFPQTTNDQLPTTNFWNSLVSYWPHFLVGFIILGFIVVAGIRGKILKSK